ncbi:MAG: hypothetical protein COA70_07515 [Planctomycetota bacterium]|nr:MAG: hypothetical protein COA70_07515 [Planctomycetota bacterium]
MLCIALLVSFALSAQTPTNIEVTDTVLQDGITRFGVNLGHTENYEASILNANIIPNPGFEAGHFAMVSQADLGSTGDHWIQDHWQTMWNNDTFGIGHPVGFWNGAEFEIVSGPSKGRIGTVLDYTHDNGVGNFFLNSSGSDPVQGDVMFLRMPIADMPEDGDLAVIETTDARPGSPGVQSLRLSVDPTQLWRGSRIWYLDTLWNNLATNSGKLQLVDGDWHFSVWAKGTQPGDSLRLKLYRSQEATYIDETFPLTTSWQLIEQTYSLPEGSDDPRAYTDQESHPILTFSLHLGGAGQEVLIDDLIMERVHTNDFGFVDEVVQGLLELNPGTLRNWSGFFGTNLAHAVADPFAAGFVNFRPNNRIPQLWDYRLHEFLGLCDLVDANPWYIVPVTWTEEDLLGLMEYLGGPADGVHPYADLRAARGQILPWTTVFDTIHLEFGNEGWARGINTDPFFGASLGDGYNLGAIGNDRFNLLKAAPEYDALKFDLVIGGQHGWAGRQSHIEGSSSAHDTIGLGPYFMRILDDFATDEAIYQRLFATPIAEAAPGGGMRTSLDNIATFGQGTKVHVYEINFHMNKVFAANPAPADLRNDVITGQGGALALPLTMLTYMRELGIKTQLAFTYAGFTQQADDGEYLRMWGLVRDILKTGRKRPTFMGLTLANHVMFEDMVETIQSGSDPVVSVTPGNGLTANVDLHLVQSFSFQQGANHSLILFNLDLTNPQDVIIDTSGPVVGRAFAAGLVPADIHADNEDEEQVTRQLRVLPGFHDGMPITLPPASMIVLRWRQ